MHSGAVDGTELVRLKMGTEAEKRIQLAEDLKQLMYRSPVGGRVSGRDDPARHPKSRRSGRAAVIEQAPGSRICRRCSEFRSRAVIPGRDASLVSALSAVLLATTLAASHAAQPVMTVSDFTSNTDFGRSIADDVDFNGDEFSDLAVGTSTSSRVDVYLGGPGHDAVADVVLTGYPALGICVRRLPDISGDGIDEIAVGATSGGSEERVVIYYGGTSPNGVADKIVPSPAPMFQPETFGYSIACGDVSGDGVADLVVGAYGYGSPPGIPRGRTYVYFGPGFGPTPNLTLTGENYGDYFGTCVAVGDVSGDGKGDVLISAPFYAGAGRVYTYYGGAGPDGTVDRVCDEPLNGGYMGNGDNIRAADMNADGVADIVAGAPQPGVNRVYIFLGGVTTSTPDLFLTAGNSTDTFGTTIAVGDFCGDASLDLVVGAPQIGQPSPGKAYVFMGGSCLDNIPEDVILGDANSKYLGLEVANVGSFLSGKDQFAVGFDREPAQTGASVTVFAPDPEDACELPAPGNALATAQCGSISLAWDVVPGATGYRVKRDGVVVSGIDPVAGPPFVDSSPGLNQRCYEVCAVNSTVGDGPYSPSTCAQAADVALVVNAQPTSIVAQQGSNDGFSVFVTGNGLTYTWRKGGVPIPGAPNRRYIVLTNIQATDAGSYDVVICNSCGCQTSQAATLQVCAPATATLPTLVRATVGDASAVIQATATPAVVPQYWMFNKQVLVNGAKYSGANTTTLVIANPTASDAGPYQLFYTGGCSENLSTNVCKFDASPCAPNVSILTHPSDQTVSLGAQASFSIQAGGCEIPTYQWQRWSDPARTWQSLPGENASTFVIGSVTAGDIGSYRCVVGAPNGSSAISNPANLSQTMPQILTVNSKPFGCGLAFVSWTTNVPMTAVVDYGADCATLVQTSTETPLGYSGSAVLDLATSPYASYRILATTPQGATASTRCAPAYFQSPLGNLSAEATGMPYYGNLYATGDAIPVRIRITNMGCGAITGPITLTDLKLNGLPPRRSDGTADLPRDLCLSGLAAGETRETMMMFSKTEVGLPSKSGVFISGLIEYGAPTRTVSVATKFVLP